jgi:diacylglycerol kinase (ATP)
MSKSFIVAAMNTGRFKLIYNPVAAQGTAAERIPEVEALMRRHGIDFDLRLTERVGHATELAAAAGKEGYAFVIAAGGDGTSNEVINGLMLASANGGPIPAMGVLSVGRGNDFGYGARIPRDLEAGVALLAEGIPRPMDVGLVKGGDYPDGKYFGNGIGVGFDAIVGFEAAKMTHVRGFMAYVLGALKTMVMYPEAPAVKVVFNGQTHEQRSHQISIMNGRRMGGTFYMAPDSINHDGLFDLCMSGKLNRREMMGLMGMYMKGTQASHPSIKTARSAQFEILAPGGGLACHADGETICVNGTSLSVRCIPSCIKIISGEERPEENR